MDSTDNNPYCWLDVETLSGVCRLRAAQLLSASQEPETADQRKLLSMDTGLMLMAASDAISACTTDGER